jgi:integrase
MSKRVLSLLRPGILWHSVHDCETCGDRGMNAPFFRSGRMTWFVTVNGKQYKIGRDPRYTKPPSEPPKKLPPELEAKYALIIQRGGEAQDRTLAFCIDEYMGSLNDCPPKTQYRARYFLDIFLSSAGDLRVSRLKSHMVDAAHEDKRWKPNTVHAFVTRIDACLNYCVRKGWIPANPIKGQTEKPTPERRKEIMSAEDRQRCLDAAKEPFKSALHFLAGTGTRPIEVRFARIEQCDLDKGVLMVRNKTRKKTGKQERPVFLSTAITHLLRRVIDDRTEGWIFRNSRGGQWSQTAFEHRFQRLCADLGITYGAQLYSFRHGWGSAAINEKGMNPALVAIQMGHTDLKQLMKTYLHADSDAMRKALDG